MDVESGDNAPPSPEHSPREHVIVEVGAGRYDSLDFWQPVAQRRAFEPSEHYIGIELGAAGNSTPLENDRMPPTEQDHIMRQGWNELMSSRPAEDIKFIQANGTVLPLPDAMADEVIFNNVFGAPRVKEFPSLLSEANRILKKNGIIVIHDDLSPRYFSNDSMNEIITAAGLTAKGSRLELLTRRDNNAGYIQLAQQYGLVSGLIHHNDAMWLIHKLAPAEPEPSVAEIVEQPTKKDRWFRRRRRSRPEA